LTRLARGVSLETAASLSFDRPLAREDTMSLMCSMQVCKAQVGMCGHEKMMFGIAVLLAAGAGAYFFLG
jgi:hypothetical protein